MRKPAVTIALIAASVLTTAGAAFASGGGEQGSVVMEWVWKVVNFAILVFILVKFAGKPLKGFLQKRTELIEKTLEEAKQARELAGKALKDVEERLKNKDREFEEILTAARESGESEKQALIKEGEKMSEKLVEQAKANIGYELQKAKEAVRAEAVDLAMELAEKKMKDKLTPDVQKRLFEESLVKLEGGK